MTRRLRRLAIAVLAVATLGLAAWGSEADRSAASGAAPAAVTHESTEPAPTTAEAIDPAAFRQEMRKLWEDHVTWTRLYIVSAIADLPDLEATAGRLLQNQDDIGAALATFYGPDAGASATGLLREHILVAADLVAAAKMGDSAGVGAQSELWYANADAIAELLAAANPAWPYEAVREMMRTHLDQTAAEVTARLEQDWDADIAAYDEIHHHILTMADLLSDGIIAQFPDRFSV